MSDKGVGRLRCDERLPLEVLHRRAYVAHLAAGVQTGVYMGAFEKYALAEEGSAEEKAWLERGAAAGARAQEAVGRANAEKFAVSVEVARLRLEGWL